MNDGLETVIRTINAKRSLADLAEEGLMFHQIAKLINEALELDLIQYDADDNPILSKCGLDFLDKASRRAGRPNGRWIEPALKQRRAATDTFEVYLPKRDVIQKLRSK